MNDDVGDRAANRLPASNNMNLWSCQCCCLHRSKPIKCCVEDVGEICIFAFCVFAILFVKCQLGLAWFRSADNVTIIIYASRITHAHRTQADGVTGKTKNRTKEENTKFSQLIWSNAEKTDNRSVEVLSFVVFKIFIEIIFQRWLKIAL